MGNERLTTLDALRGIASLAVCWFHLTNGNTHFLPEGWLKASGRYGWVGVEVFFVISGFVIPYALYRSKYRLTKYWRFVLKRITRLDPPYIATVAIIIALGYASWSVPGFAGQEFRPSLVQVMLHLCYVNVFFGYPWLNIIFWSLAIEFQYYLLIGLCFPILVSKSRSAKIASLAGFAALAFVLPQEQFLFHYVFLFLLGIVTFHYRIGLMGLRPYLVILPLLTCGLVFSLGPLITVVGLSTALTIAFVNLRSRVLLFFGQISYSLYLLHTSIGGRVINLGERFTSNMFGRSAVLLVSLVVSIGAAYALYRLVERPAQEWSNRISYKVPRSHPIRQPALSIDTVATE
jgi:peptidoglycan/LPS O-acetylase OafA/YrhL